MKALAIIPMAAALCGCVSIVSVQADGGKPHLSVWPGGVKVERGEADAVTVDHLTIGGAYNCGFFGIGLSKVSCTVVRADGCIAIIHSPDDQKTALMSKIAGEARATCLKGKPQWSPIPSASLQSPLPSQPLLH